MGRIATIFLALAALCVPAVKARADFGPLGVDCRALGRGGAFAADAEGPASLYWNPAGLARCRGVNAVLSYGLLQRPDWGDPGFGNTGRLYLALGLGGDVLGSEGMGMAAALETPFPRFSYAHRGTWKPAGTPHDLSLDVSQDYLELLLGGGLTFFEGEALGGDGVIRLGANVGLGFASGDASAFLAGPAAPAGGEAADGGGTDVLLPAGLGLQIGLKFEEVAFSLAVRYRGVTPLTDARGFSFAQSGVELTGTDLYMPPPQEGTLALSVIFHECLVYALDLTYFFFDGPDAAPNVVPHNYPQVKLGFEYRIPFAEDEKEIAVRFGLSQASVPKDNLESVYTNDALGVYFGWGFRLDPFAHLELYFTLQMPGEGDVDEDTFLASLSYSVTF